MSDFFVRVNPDTGVLVSVPNPCIGLNTVTVVSDESMDGIEAHIADMNNQNYRLISSIGRGNHVMLFWEKVK